VKGEYAGSVLPDFVVFSTHVDLEKMWNICSLRVIGDLLAEAAIVCFIGTICERGVLGYGVLSPRNLLILSGLGKNVEYLFAPRNRRFAC